MGRLLASASLALSLLFADPAYPAETPVDLELALAIDVSRSIDWNEARLQRDGYVQAFRDPDVINAIKNGVLGRIAVSYFEWASSVHVEVILDWTIIDGKESAYALADALARQYPANARRTSISSAIDFAVPWFDRNNFQGTRRVLDISGDGPNNAGGLVTEARDRAVAKGITINGLPILDENNGGFFSRFNIANLDLYYRDCVIGGPSAFIEVARDFNDFARAIRRKLILEIAGVRPPPQPRLWRAQASLRAQDRVSPPCDIGEQLMRGLDNF